MKQQWMLLLICLYTMLALPGLLSASSVRWTIQHAPEGGLNPNPNPSKSLESNDSVEFSEPKQAQYQRTKFAVGTQLGYHWPLNANKAPRQGSGGISGLIGFEMSLGFGLKGPWSMAFRSQDMVGFAQFEDEESLEWDRYILITNSLFSLSYQQPFFSDELIWGVSVGAGTSSYSETLTPEQDSSGAEEQSFKTAGSLLMLGLFLDRGKQGFGIRGGVEYLRFTYDDSGVDPSGISAKLMLRWQF